MKHFSFKIPNSWPNIKHDLLVCHSYWKWQKLQYCKLTQGFHWWHANILQHYCWNLLRLSITNATTVTSNYPTESQASKHPSPPLIASQCIRPACVHDRMGVAVCWGLAEHILNTLLIYRMELLAFAHPRPSPPASAPAQRVIIVCESPLARVAWAHPGHRGDCCGVCHFDSWPWSSICQIIKHAQCSLIS